jgi:hypothetical protein
MPVLVGKRNDDNTAVRILFTIMRHRTDCHGQEFELAQIIHSFAHERIANIGSLLYESIGCE